jgi:hypothetical protein
MQDDESSTGAKQEAPGKLWLPQKPTTKDV